MISQGWYVAGLLAFGWLLTLLAWAWRELTWRLDEPPTQRRRIIQAKIGQRRVRPDFFASDDD